MRNPEVEIRRIDSSRLPTIRKAVLWPSIPIESQLQTFDHADTTTHYGTFLPHLENPVGCLTLTKEKLKTDLPPGFSNIEGLAHYQVHKFAVYKEYQGKGVGSTLFRHVLREVRGMGDRKVLLHLDARVEQRGWYERFGLRVLDEDVFVKTGPTGNGPAIEYIRLGIVLDTSNAS
jgi:GNAT superfamily N-acetyltransferase